MSYSQLPTTITTHIFSKFKNHNLKTTLRGDAQKNNILFTDIGQIKFYPTPSYPIFDNLLEITTFFKKYYQKHKIVHIK